MSIAPSPSHAGAQPDAEADSRPDLGSVAGLGAHTAIRATLEAVAAALVARDKRAATEHLLSLDRTLGNGWHPARHALRGIDAAVDIGRWDLAAEWLGQVQNWLTLDPQPEGEGV